MHDIPWFEVLKLVATFATPIVVLVLGILVIRRIEGIKAVVARQSDFRRKWADQFFDSCQDFLRALERELAAFRTIANLSDLKQHDGLGEDLQKEICRLHPTIMELELRIRRCVVFAPMAGPEVSANAIACLNLVGSLVAKKTGNLDIITHQMNMFNTAARRAHAELLHLRVAELDGKG